MFFILFFRCRSSGGVKYSKGAKGASPLSLDTGYLTAAAKHYAQVWVTIGGLFVFDSVLKKVSAPEAKSSAAANRVLFLQILHRLCGMPFRK